MGVFPVFRLARHEFQALGVLQHGAGIGVGLDVKMNHWGYFSMVISHDDFGDFRWIMKYRGEWRCNHQHANNQIQFMVNSIHI